MSRVHRTVDSEDGPPHGEAPRDIPAPRDSPQLLHDGGLCTIRQGGSVASEHDAGRRRAATLAKPVPHDRSYCVLMSCRAAAASSRTWGSASLSRASRGPIA